MRKSSEYVILGKSYCEDCFNKLHNEGKLPILTDDEADMKKMQSADSERRYTCSECNKIFFG